MASSGDGEQGAYIGEDPFLAPREERRADRRLRGRFVAPVTIWTAGRREEPAGLTVSSVLVAEGEPAHLVGLIDPLSALFERAMTCGTLVVHVLGANDRRLAELFAGGYPVDPFAELAWSEDPFGPVLTGTRTVVRCRVGGSEPLGFQSLVKAAIESVDFAPGTRSDPLAWYHGVYRRLA